MLALLCDIIKTKKTSLSRSFLIMMSLMTEEIKQEHLLLQQYRTSGCSLCSCG